MIPKKVQSLPELLKMLSQPPSVAESAIFKGDVSVWAGPSLVFGYGGTIVIVRNPDITNWYSIEKAIPDRDRRSPEFAAQFYKTGDWIHVPYDPLSSGPTDYIKTAAHLGSNDSSLLVEARIHVHKKG